MENISVGGLVSGIDTNSIIDGLTSLERSKVVRVEKEKKLVEDRKAAFNDLVGRLSGFNAKAGALKEVSGFNAFKATSNDDEVVTVQGSEGATPGQYEMKVAQLANTAKFSSKSFTSIVNPLGLSGTFDLATSAAVSKVDPSKTKTSISIQASDTLKDVARKINSADGVGVSASLLTLSNGENRLVLTAKDTGTNPAFMKETAGNVLSAGLGLITNDQKARSSFSLLKQAGGPAALTDTLDKLSTGIGANNLTNGDIFRISGEDSNGVAFTRDLVIDPTSTKVQDVLAELNTGFGGTATASLDENGEFVVKDTAGGSSTMKFKFELVDSDATGSTMAFGESRQVNDYANLVTEGRNAFFTLDGMAVSSKSNSASDIVRGTTFTLKKAVPDQAVQLKLDVDTDGIMSKIKSFVEEYNSLLKFIDEKTKVTVTKDTSNTASNGRQPDSIVRGPLSGDGMVRKIRSELGSILIGVVDNLAGDTQYTSLSRVGITTSSNNDGSIEVKEDKLKEALTADLEGVRRLFAASGKSDNPNIELGRYTKDTKAGVYQVDPANDLLDRDAKSTVDTATAGRRLGDVLTAEGGDSKGLSLRAPKSAGTGTFTFTRGIASQVDQWYQVANDFVSGTFKQTREGYDRQLKQFDKRADDLADKVERFRTQLVKEFSAMEQNMSRLKSQNASFMAQMG